MTTKLPDEQSKIDQRIVDEIFAVIPEEWTAFLVTIEPRTGLDGGGQAITILQPDQADAAVEASDDLRAAVGEIADYFRSVERPWERLTYMGWVDPQGAWHMKITAPLP